MADLLLDTHTLIWYLETSPNLSPRARAAIKTCIGAGDVLYVSAVSLAEVLYLEEKGRLAPGTLALIVVELARPDSGIADTPFTAGVAQAMSRVSRSDVPDLPDRMIAGTALHLGISLVTADHRIRSAGLPTIW